METCQKQGKVCDVLESCNENPTLLLISFQVCDCRKKVKKQMRQQQRQKQRQRQWQWQLPHQQMLLHNKNCEKKGDNLNTSFCCGFQCRKKEDEKETKPVQAETFLETNHRKCAAPLRSGEWCLGIDSRNSNFGVFAVYWM